LRPIICAFFDEPDQNSELIAADPAASKAAVTDPVLDYDSDSGEVDTPTVEAMLRAAAAEGKQLECFSDHPVNRIWSPAAQCDSEADCPNQQYVLVAARAG